MSYQALYRKYRPKTFDDVVGQEHITVTLKNQVAGDKLSHAYLFIGTRGTGKTTCAKILARAANCLSPENGNPCNKCASCLGIEDGSILDVVELDAASNNGVDNVRAMREEAVFLPASVKKRVYIVDEVHMLSTAAFNALLKILEEPPPHLIFILATTELHKVPATILSRCQRHTFRRIDDGDIASLLKMVAEKEAIGLTDGAASMIARLADGAMRDALSLLDQCAPLSGELDEAAVLNATGLSGSRKIAALLEKIHDGSMEDALALFDELWRAGKSPVTILSELASFLRDILILQIAPKGGRGLLSGSYTNDILAGFARRAGAARLMRELETIEAAQTEMRNSASLRLGAELCVMRLADPKLGGDIPAIELRLGALEERLEGMTFSAAPVAEAPPVQAEPEPAAEPELEPEDEEEDDDVPFVFEEEADTAEMYDDAPPWNVPELEPKRIPEPREDAVSEPAAAPEPAEVPPPEEIPESAEIPAPEEAPAPKLNTGPEASSPEFRKRLCDNLPRGADVGSMMILLNPALSGLEVEGDEVRIIVGGEFAYNLINKPDFLAAVKSAASLILGEGARVTVKEGDTAVESAPRRSLDELSHLDNVTFEN